MADLAPVWAVQVTLPDRLGYVDPNDGIPWRLGPCDPIPLMREDQALRDVARWKPEHNATILKLRLVPFDLDPALLARERDAARAEVERLRAELGRAVACIDAHLPIMRRGADVPQRALAWDVDAFLGELRQVLEAKP